MPITMIIPMNDATLNVVLVTSNARNPPNVESNADARIAAGAENVRNSNSSTAKSSKQRQQQHHQQIMKGLLLLFVLPAVLHADRRRQMQIFDRFLHRVDPASQIDPSSRAGHLHQPLQIFSPNFGLARCVTSVAR